jgi:hypothetical protein
MSSDPQHAGTGVYTEIEEYNAPSDDAPTGIESNRIREFSVLRSAWAYVRTAPTPRRHAWFDECAVNAGKKTPLLAQNLEVY